MGYRFWAASALLAFSSYSQALAEDGGCVFAGQGFSSGMAVTIGDKAYRCLRGDDGIYIWNFDAKRESGERSIGLCLFGGRYYAESAKLDGLTCSETGIWK